MRGIAAKGSLPHDVLVAMALKALPMDFTNRLVVAPGGDTWDSLYEGCSVWEATGLDGRGISANCFSNKTSDGNLRYKNNNSKEINMVKCFFL